MMFFSLPASLPAGWHLRRAVLFAVLCGSLATLANSPAAAQFDIFGGSDRSSRQQQNPGPDPNDGDVLVRLDRLEGQLRQFTGTIEQLTYQNQQLQAQLKRMQEDNESRFQQMGGGRGGAAPPPAARGPQPQSQPPQAAPGRRSDIYDPGANPNAPGAPRPLGGGPGAVASAAPPIDTPYGDQPIGAPGGREAGAPLNLSGLSDPADNEGPPGPQGRATGGLAPGPGTLNDQINNPLPQPPARNPGAAAGVAGGERVATLPPSASPKDEYDLGVGYVKRKDYALANQAFDDFLRRHPGDPLAPDVHYWLGESFFQQQQFRDAARSFLTVTTKFENSAKAPESMLRLSQSLAALGQKDTACAALREIGGKYPRASASVKQGVAREQKRANC